MKKKIGKTVAAAGLCLALLAGSVTVGAAFNGAGGQEGTEPPAQTEGFRGFCRQQGGQMPGGMPGMGQQQGGQLPGGMPGMGQQQGGQMPGGMPGMGQQQGGQMPGGMPGMGQQQGGQMPGGMPGIGQQQGGQMPGGMPGMNQQQEGQQPGGMPGMDEQNGGSASTTDTAGEIVTGTTENGAMGLTADYDSAVTYDVSEGSVKITQAGTYIVTGVSSDASVTVKKGTTGVVLVLQDLDLTSTQGAALSINKEAEVQVVVTGSVKLTDAEDPADEYSEDPETADAYDGAAIKIKAGAEAYITGTGTLTVTGSAKNGIKAGDEASLILDTAAVNITAANDGINGNYDVTILGGTVTITAGDDGIHADRILTLGAEGTGPSLTVVKSTEGLEGTVVNIAGGKITVNASDDGINAANADGAYEGVLDYAVNVTGGDLTVTTSADGIDSNGSVNLISGSASIRSASMGGEAGIDYDGEYYVSPDFRLNNQSGVAGPDNMPGMGGMGGMPGGMGAMPGMGGRMGG